MVFIGDVTTWDTGCSPREQALKPLEEAAEVFSAWQDYDRTSDWGSDWDEFTAHNEALLSIVEECCDVVQATCNLLALLGVDDIRPHMAECLERQRERGRL